MRGGREGCGHTTAADVLLPSTATTITDTSATAGHDGRNELRGGRAMRGGREGRGARGGSGITPAASTTIDTSATVGGRDDCEQTVAHLLTFTMTLSDDKAGTSAGPGGRGGLGHSNSSLVLPTSIAASSNPRATTTDVASTCEESLLQSSNDAGHISSITTLLLTTTAEVSTTTIALNAGEVQQPEINRQDNIILLTDEQQVPSESLNARLLLKV
jgi:hypothetical protein